MSGMMINTLAMLSAACSIWSCKEQPATPSLALIVSPTLQLRLSLQINDKKGAC
jgi:hypothetical protein